jgi:hypothetical protein
VETVDKMFSEAKGMYTPDGMLTLQDVKQAAGFRKERVVVRSLGLVILRQSLLQRRWKTPNIVCIDCFSAGGCSKSAVRHDKSRKLRVQAAPVP